MRTRPIRGFLSPLHPFIVMKTPLRYPLLLLGLLALPVPIAAQSRAADADWLAEVLQLRPGSVVADIGAGDGELTIAAAHRVGPGGRVYSSELGRERVERLRRAVAATGLSNITVVDGHPTRTNLPERCCDAIFLRNVYHHFDAPAPMNASLWRSLRPGGRLAVIDFAPRGRESREPDGRDEGEQHGVTAGTLVRELRAAGFETISEEERGGRTVYVVARRPGEG